MGGAVIVEFIGAPGAGKTVLMPVVGAHFDRLGFQALSVLEAARPFAARTRIGKAVQSLAPGRPRRFLLWQVFYLFSFLHRQNFRRRNPALIGGTLAFQRQRPITAADRHHVLRWFIHLTGTYEFLSAYSRQDEVLVFDEGFVHRVVQLFASENEQPDPARVAAYLDLIPQPDLVIFPSASSATCERRVFERGVWERFRVKERDATSRFIANAHRVVTFAVGYIRSKGWTVIEVDNDNREISASLAALQENLEALETDFGSLSEDIPIVTPPK